MDDARRSADEALGRRLEELVAGSEAPLRTMARLRAARERFLAANRSADDAGQLAAVRQILDLIERGAARADLQAEVRDVLAARDRLRRLDREPAAPATPRGEPPAEAIVVSDLRPPTDGRRPILVVGLRRPDDVEVDLGPSVTSRRLEALLGIRRGSLLQAVDAVNLLGPGDPEGAGEDLPFLRARARDVLPDARTRALVLVLGRDVSEAMGFPRTAPTAADGSVARIGTAACLLVPHPSGRNRMWNDPTVRARVAAGVRALSSHLVPQELRWESWAEGPQEDLEEADWREAFVAVVQRTGNRGAAAVQAAVSLALAERAERDEPEFAARVREAERSYAHGVALEVHRRGVEGVDEPLVSGGRVIGRVRKYSDRLLELQARAVLPRVYRDRDSADVATAAGGDFVLDVGEAGPGEGGDEPADEPVGESAAVEAPAPTRDGAGG